MNKMKYNTNKRSNEKLSKQGQSSAIWNQNKVPPLVSISILAKQQQKQKQTIQSLGHSDIISIYAQQQVSPQRNHSQIYSYPFDYIKDLRYQQQNDRQEIYPADKQETFIKGLTRTNNQLFLNFKNPPNESQTQLAHKKSFRQHSKLFQLHNCKAIQLYNKILHQKESPNQISDSFNFQWMDNKTSSQLLATLMTNSSKLNLYIHYLIKQIDINQRNRLLNQLYQQEIKSYNPNLKEIYMNIICIISKLFNQKQQKQHNVSSNVKNNRYSKNVNEMPIEVSLYENGINLNIDPKLSKIKISNNARIRELKHILYDQEQKIENMKKVYQGIIQNYALSIENIATQTKQSQMKEHMASFANVLPATLKQSRVFLEVDESYEQDKIRHKNHTFGINKNIRTSRNDVI